MGEDWTIKILGGVDGWGELGQFIYCLDVTRIINWDTFHGIVKETITVMCYSVLKYFSLYATSLSGQGARGKFEKFLMGTAFGNKGSWEVLIFL